MAANPPDSAEKWDACWNALESLPGCDLPTVAMHAEAVRIISSYRAVTEGRGIERIEDRAQAAYRLGVGGLAAGSDEHLNRFMVALSGALSVLRRVPRESPAIRDDLARHPDLDPARHCWASLASAKRPKIPYPAPTRLSNKPPRISTLRRFVVALAFVACSLSLTPRPALAGARSSTRLHRR